MGRISAATEKRLASGSSIVRAVPPAGALSNDAVVSGRWFGATAIV